MTITIILLTAMFAVIFSVITAFTLGVHVALIQKNSAKQNLKSMSRLHDAIVDNLDQKMDILIEQQTKQSSTKRR